MRNYVHLLDVLRPVSLDGSCREESGTACWWASTRMEITTTSRPRSSEARRSSCDRFPCHPEKFIKRRFHVPGILITGICRRTKDTCNSLHCFMSINHEKVYAQCIDWGKRVYNVSEEEYDVYREQPECKRRAARIDKALRTKNVLGYSAPHRDEAIFGVLCSSFPSPGRT